MIFDIILLIIVIIMIIKHNNFDKFTGNLLKTFSNNEDIPYLSQKLKTTINEMDIASNNNYYETAQNPNYNTLNDLPYLIDPQNSNEGYYNNKCTIQTNPNSDLLKKEKQNKNKINKLLLQPTEENNIGGYNKYVNLSRDSPAPLYSIGKSLLSPYISYPVGTVGQ
jgi:hypothetical protein